MGKQIIHNKKLHICFSIAFHLFQNFPNTTTSWRASFQPYEYVTYILHPKDSNDDQNCGIPASLPLLSPFLKLSYTDKEDIW